MADDGAGECHVAKLPQGLLYLVLSRLPGRDAAAAECVHPTWHATLNECDLWIQMAKRDWLVTDEEIRAAGLQQAPSPSQPQRENPRRAASARGEISIVRCSSAARASASSESPGVSAPHARPAEPNRGVANAEASVVSESDPAKSARTLYGSHYFSYRRYGSLYPRARRVWHVLRTWLRAHIPELDETLLAGATEQQLDAAEAALGVTFPPAVRALYRVCDGQMPRYDKMVVEVRGEQRRRRGRGRRARGGGAEGRRRAEQGSGGGEEEGGTDRTMRENEEEGEARAGEEGEADRERGGREEEDDDEEGEGEAEAEEEEEEEEDEEAAVGSIFHGLLGSYSFYDHWVSTRLLPLRRIVAGTLQIRTRVAATRRTTALLAHSRGGRRAGARGGAARGAGGAGRGAGGAGFGGNDWPETQILIGASFNYSKLFFLDCATGMVSVGGSDVLHACTFLPCVPPSRPHTCPNPLVSEVPLAVADVVQQASTPALQGSEGGNGAGASATDASPEAPSTAPGSSGGGGGCSRRGGGDGSSDADGMVRWLEEYSWRLANGWYRVRTVVDDIPARGICLFPEQAPLCSVAVTRGVCVRASALFVPEVAPLVLPRPSAASDSASGGAAVAGGAAAALGDDSSGGGDEEAEAAGDQRDGRGGTRRRRGQRGRRVVGAGGQAEEEDEEEEEEGEGQRCFAYSVRMKLLPLDQPQEVLPSSIPHVTMLPSSSTHGSGSQTRAQAASAAASHSSAWAAHAMSIDHSTGQLEGSAGDMSACQLRSRHWVIKEEGEVVAEVRGDAVVGEYPILRRGGSEFVYQSCSQMTGQWGTIEGDFTFVPGGLMRPTGADFDAAVAPFPLQVPDFVF